MAKQWLDHSKPVRPGEELDMARLLGYLQAGRPELAGRDLAVEQFPSGFSNLTYLLKLGDRELVLRRPPFGANVRGGHDMLREYTLLSRLVDVYPYVPRPLLYCDDETILGAPFYVMERLTGVILRPQMPPAMIPEPPLMARIAGSFAQNFAALHAVDIEAAGLADLGRPQGYIQRQITGWTGRYHKARTDDIRETERVAAWLADKMPPESGAALIHNDYKYDNLVLDPADWSRIIGVLDWEMATIGDPLMDLGSSLGYWVEAADPPAIRALQFSPTTLPGNPTRAELVEQYARWSGRDVSNILYYYIYGLFKLAVIVQQIYYRYRKGYTQDPRFADLIQAVRACSQAAVRAIDNDRMAG